MLDATTAIEDKTFWENAGFDPLAIVAAGLDSLARQQPRRFDDHPAARPGPRLLDPELRAGPGPDDRAQAQGDHPVDPGDAVLRRAGRRRQAADHHRLPQPELLRQPELRREGRGPLVLRHRAGRADTGQAAILAGLPKSPSNYDLVRNANETLRQRGRKTTQPVPPPRASSSSRRTRVIVQRRDQILELLAGRPDPDVGGRVQRRRARPRTTARSSSSPGRRRRAGCAPHFVWAVRDELTVKLCGEDTPSCDELEQRRPARHHDPGPRPPEDRREVGQGRGDRPATAGPTGGGCRQGPRLRSLRAVDAQSRGQEPAQRRAGRARLRDRRARRLRRLGRVLRDASRPEFQPQYDVVGPGLPPAGLGLQAVQLRRSASTTGP